GTNRITVPARPTSTFAGPCNAAGRTDQSPPTSSMPTPIARSASTINTVSRLRSGRLSREGSDAIAASTSARLVSDFEPGTTPWPAALPRDLPKPLHARIQQATTTTDGVHIIKFTTQTSLRDGVLFVVRRLPKAGYVLGRGDAEASEADAPFVHGNTRGLYR